MSAEYFLEELTEWEALLIMQSLGHSDRPMWEASRMQAYVQASVWSQKKLRPEDIMRFPWDGDDGEKSEITDADVAHLERVSAMIAEKMRDVWQ